MKLRYYLRGLAAGVLITTIILAIANAGNRPLTDAQIRQRALELGMIESESVKLSSLQHEETVPAESSAKGSEKSTEESSEKDSAESTPEPTVKDSAESTPESGVKDSAESTPEPTEKDSEESTSKPPEKDSAESTPESTVKDSAESSSAETGSADVQPVSFRIASGSNSYTVSKELAALGLVEDAVAFDTFLCDKGYSKKIRVGTYEILPGTSEEDIAKMIAQ